jgi:hypothetical protein
MSVAIDYLTKEQENMKTKLQFGDVELELTADEHQQITDAEQVLDSAASYQGKKVCKHVAVVPDFARAVCVCVDCHKDVPDQQDADEFSADYKAGYDAGKHQGTADKASEMLRDYRNILRAVLDMAQCSAYTRFDIAALLEKERKAGKF